MNKEQIEPGEVIKMMIGKELSLASASNDLRKPAGEAVLEVKNLCRKGVLHNISFTAHKGEILGIGGLVGSGRTEVLRCIFGTDRFDSGEILFGGQALSGNSKARIAQGFGLIPEDRRGQGFIPLLSIEKNVALTNYDTLSRGGVVKTQAEKQMGQDAVKRLDVRPGNPVFPVGNLSGGNAQKVVLGKWLMRDLKVLLIDEPTAGIDVGAKDEIYKIMEELAAKGVTVIMVSSDLQELLRVSHRILVFRKGAVFWEFCDGVVTQEDILMTASGIKPDEKEVV